MRTQPPIAIVGGGPAGALAGALLAADGRDVLLFDEKLAWEKPCGGGLTHKALQQYPFLADAGSESNPVEHCELISPSGQRVRFHMQYPVAIFSRLALNGLLLERARRAGVDLRHERVTRIARTGADWQLLTPQHEYQASHLMLAAGARNLFRSQFLSPISPSDLMVTAGYFIPGRSSLMQIQFLKGITGYIWVFPRADHVSAGIAGKMGGTSTAELRRILEQWLEENGFHLDGARFYSHILPSFRPQTFETLEVCGEGWAMIGDSAGLVDPITGEGLYYALRSAELCAGALLAGRPNEYRALLKEDVLAELKLAARVSQRFYSGQIFGDSVLERMVSLTAQSPTFRDLMSDLFAGIQGYRDLRSRLYRILPEVMAEGLAGTLCRPWNRSTGGELATDPFAD
jgi:flavin-dependent dehydrogenase